MISKRVLAVLLALFVAWGSIGCILVAKSAIDEARGTSEEDEEEKKKQ